MSDLRPFFPVQRKSKILISIDGKELELSPLEAAVIAQRWQEAIGGAYVAKMMEVALDQLEADADD